MLKKRIIVCLDVRNGRTTKGIRFKDNQDIGDPVAMAKAYYRAGTDELVFYDITASPEGRSIMLDVVTAVAEKIFIPFSVGGGIGTLKDMRAVILAGAEKVSVNSRAVCNPGIIEEGASLFGRQCIVVGIDAARDPEMPSGYRVFINGGRTPTDLDVMEWAARVEQLGAGEIVLNSIDADGTKAGYECVLTSLVSGALEIPVVASGGAGSPEDILRVFRDGKADAALIASMVHYGTWTVGAVKEYLAERGIPVRMDGGNFSCLDPDKSV